MIFHLQRHSSLRKSRKSLKSLVLILLLSLVGQAWAVPAVCTMADMTNVEMTDSSMTESSPCHSMKNQSADAGADTMSMDCCDSSTDVDHTMSHDCSCPDSGCSASFTMAVGFTSAVHIVHEQAVHYSTIHFLNRISTSLYRPPIA